MEDGEGSAGGVGGVAHGECWGEAEGHGLFDHDVFAGGECGEGVVGVEGGGCGDEDGVGAVEGGVGGVDGGEAVGVGEGAAGGGGVVDGGDGEVGGADPGGVFAADAPVSEDGDVEHGEVAGSEGDWFGYGGDGGAG